MGDRIHHREFNRQELKTKDIRVLGLKIAWLVCVDQNSLRDSKFRAIRETRCKTNETLRDTLTIRYLDVSRVPPTEKHSKEAETSAKTFEKCIKLLKI